jgi:hypothetical protein
MENNFDTEIARATNQWIMYGIIKALAEKNPSFPWTISEQLSNVRPDRLPRTSALGLEIAMEWVFTEFTRNAPP